MKEQSPTLTIALAGQPNVGKSTVFNMLTGLNQHVGNWSGKTVEQKIGFHTLNGQVIRLVDLPGTYSLTANSEEERIAREFLLHEKPDVVVVIVNATALERNLYLVAELLNMSVNVVVGLNMVDVAEHQGLRVEAHVLQAALGIPVVPLIASRNQGVAELLDAALCLLKNPAEFTPNRPEIQLEHQQLVTEICSMLGENNLSYPKDWIAIKLLEGDAEISEMVRQSLPEQWASIEKLLMQHEDAYLDVASGRYEWIGRMVRAAVVKPKLGTISITDRIDKIATHPFWGLILLVGIFGLAFWLTYAAAMPVVGWIDTQFISFIAESLRQALISAPPWLTSLLVDGLLAGAGAVLALLPVLIVFFAVLGLLEDIGYLSRSAYVMDRFMHSLGLHGRSFLPLFIGFGCNVPSILGARILEERRARLLTILLAPLIPCTARMAVIAFLAPAFFGQNAAIVTSGLVAFNILLLFLVGLVINRSMFKGMRSAFIMEMPLYHMPNARTINLYVWQNIWAFLKKAGTVILAASAVIWLFTHLPNGNIQESYLAQFGRWLEPAGRLLGLGDWRLIVSLMFSFVAKENTIAALGILFGSNGDLGLAEQVASTLTYAGALAFLVVQMTFIPCVASVSVMKQETGGWKWPAFSVGLLLAISLCAGIFVYQFVRIIGL